MHHLLSKLIPYRNQLFQINEAQSSGPACLEDMFLVWWYCTTYPTLWHC